MTAASQEPIRWPAEAIWQAVEPQLPGFTIEIMPSIDSTNTELMRRAREGRQEPILLVAEQQTAGRGRLGRPWRSEVGDSLMFSLGLPLAPRDWSGLSLAVGVSVAESLQPQMSMEDRATLQAPKIGLKWPNDLWLTGDRKLAGILVETASFMASGDHSTSAGGYFEQQALRYVVIGIGINVRAPQGEGLSTIPGSLQMVDSRWDAPQALAAVVPALVATVQAFARQGFAPLQQRFAARDALAGRAVSLSDGTQGTAQGVAADGALQVQTAAGLVGVTSSEISVRPQAPVQG
ncbi:BirA family biotin operon repressor/biotin-[acetyl-CoA-carboxylase] ligase [Comamonas odontotermitis]|uniref:biotin--[biotin carboxyl-carrier protein] ligase n=1 Tax=Comamonas odontotermitis TaxID=379895 RepID=A0ABR6RB02_9BURK|nr:biotin--[acetyl-CoA-carboxylase] ligase [Comamonas odontotermitis]MBB6576234.1 BirA family biotin operon repressor/biotin-[acetyl-CoA-carboxylase] ligase [Comamonas odontotermitis]